MAHSVTFYPVGNGDSSLLKLQNGRWLLVDYCHSESGEDEENPLIDLAQTLRGELAAANRTSFDVVMFTHADDDHIRGSTDFFELWYAEKYQTKGRIKIDQLWVPASLILEEGLTGEKRTLRDEARYRLKLGKGIRVFSKPERLKEWLEQNGIRFADRKHLITDAGQVVPGFTYSDDGVEFFVHSPFVAHVDDKEINRNESAIVMHATFQFEAANTKFLMVGDSNWEVMGEIVRKTQKHGNQSRLEWDIYNVPHHCSYLAIGPEKGKEKTLPTEDVRWLLEQGRRRGIMISSSDVIENDYDQNDPPHVQAKNTYNEFLRAKTSRDIMVTMEHDSIERPAPITILIDEDGCRPKVKAIISGGAILGGSTQPRAGNQ